MSNLPDRSDSPRWPAEPEPQPSGINWGPVIVLAVAGPTVVAYGAIILWWMGLLW